MKQLFLNGTECDLSVDTVIALTLQINDIGGIADRQANYTNTFKLPLTTVNKQILESSEIIQSSTKRPYRKLLAQYKQNGAEIIHNGIAVIESSDDNYNITIYSGNKTFFDIIEGLKLSDIDCSDLDFVWSRTAAYGMRLNTDGLIFPIVDYGNASLLGRDFNIPNAFPWIFFHTLIDRIVAKAGYTITGDILDTDIYKNLIVSLPTLKEDSQKLLASAYDAADHTYSAEDLAEVIPLLFDTITLDPLEAVITDGVIQTITPGFWGEYTQYNVLNAGAYSFKAVVNYAINDVVGTSIQIAVEGSAVADFLATSAIIPAAGIHVEGTVTLIATSIQLNVGDKIVVRAITGQSGPNSGNFIIQANSTFDCTGVDSPVIAPYTWFPVAMNLPDLSQKDFIKVLLQMFGIFIQIDELTKVISLIQFKKILSNRSVARDWSAKRDAQQRPQIKYRIGNYSQTNWLRYKDDSTVTKNLGDGSFTIDDTTLPVTSDQFTIPFAATIMKTAFKQLDVPLDVRTVADPDALLTDTLVVTEESSPRILILNRTDLGADNFEYFDKDGSLNNTDDENLAYFILPDKLLNLGFGNNLIEQNYSGLATTLDRCKDVTGFYKLDVGDVTDFDFSIPVYDSFYDNYFYVNKISQFIEGQLTQVELVRIKDYSQAVKIFIVDHDSFDICVDSAALVLGATQDGGVFFGPGVLFFEPDGHYYFDPSILSAGTYAISYDIDGEIYTIDVTLHDNPTLTPFADVSQTDPPFTLTGGTPTGGYYTVDDVVQTVFDPSAYSIGIHSIKYYSLYGCGTFQNIQVTA